jgi:RND family efflux transporter MFP subunit
MNDQLSNDLAALRIVRDEKPRSSAWLKRLAIVAALGGLGTAAYLYGVPAVEQRVFKTEVELTQILAVSPTEAESKLTSTGYVVPQRTSKVGAKLAGRIAAVHVVEGERVTKGQLLAELDGADMLAQLQTAKARVTAARAAVETAKAELADAKQKAARERKLAQSGFGAAAAAEDLEARVPPAQRQVAAQLANLKAMQAEVEALEANIQYLTVHAPMDGVVISKPAQAGEVVGIQAAQIVEIADFASLVVETDVPEGKLHLIGVGDPCDIILDAYPERTLGGRVKEISPRVNRAKATVTVKVGFEDDTKDVLPDMSARVTFLAAERDPNAEREKPKTVVPKAGIADRDGGKVVFVFEDGVVAMKSIEVGGEIGTGYELLSGPGVGTKIVRDPSDELRDGQKVKQGSESQ